MLRERLAEIGQEIVLTDENVQKLNEVEKFYASIGGVVGYHNKVLALLDNTHIEKRRFTKAPQLSLTKEATIAGIKALPQFGEIYPLGGLGSRLDLRDDKGNALPAASLPFLGRTLLEGLIRDVQAREHLYFELFGERVITPIAMMGSDERPHILKLCEESNWFGRGKENFFLFKQPSVPVLTTEGEWLTEDDVLVCQPNGHGAIWKAALDNGIFDWFEKKGRSRLLVRQINNPIAGVDDCLLSFMGTGVMQNKAFGFSSCERAKGVQEGMLVLVEKEGKQCISNIEYTELEKEGIEDQGFPANTNILYVDLKKLLPIIKKNPLPGLMVNLKGDKTARLESMMQNISDTLMAPIGEELPTFLTFNERRRTISSAKRKFEEGKGVASTPQGAYLDWMANARELLKKCGFELPEYFAFNYTPSLGPLYSIIEQKLLGGKIEEGSELVLDHPDIYIENLYLKGSLQVRGKCRLENVRVKNRGIKGGSFWDHALERDETVEIIGNFWAQDVELTRSYHVPEGEAWKLTPTGLKKAADWRFSYLLNGRNIDVDLLS
ncbi:MAG: UTP--glucose-1-phosphate uridylyltransferase [Chlamydiales bacterium]|nr:UTP--glucose-1-phosphate uridylyltransferase [Chlamydiales bacterium]